MNRVALYYRDGSELGELRVEDVDGAAPRVITWQGVAFVYRRAIGARLIYEEATALEAKMPPIRACGYGWSEMPEMRELREAVMKGSVTSSPAPDRAPPTPAA